MKFTAQQVFEKLVRDEQIQLLEGKIQFYLGDVNIIVKQRDVVGNIMQEWLEGWLKQRGIEYAPSENTQMPPDFYLNSEDKTKNLLEVKAFNRSAGPGFDIADFNVYQEEIINKPYMLDVDYLIFGYDMSDDGKVTIKDVWLKKVWEITRRMDKWPMNLQIKDNVVHKIRPAVWYSDEERVDYTTFNSLEEFISAMEETVYQNPKTHNKAGDWKNSFLISYQDYYGISLNIPRWNDIKDSFDVKTKRKLAKAKGNLEKAENRKDKSDERVKKLLEILAKAKIDGDRAKIKKAEADVIKAESTLREAQEKLKKAVENYNSLL